MYVEVTCKECESKNLLPIKEANRNYKCSCGNVIVLEKVDAGHSTLRFVPTTPEATPSHLLAMAPTQTPPPSNSENLAHEHRRTEFDKKDLSMGNKSFGSYEILEIVGKGGMGNVYKAKQKGLDRIVALKTMIAGEAASVEMIERFQLEARSAGKLKHPNIVQVYEVGEIESKHFFAMDFVDGPSLKEVIHSRQMPVKEIFELMIKVAEAIQYAHQQGIIHRDLKPHNILINSRGEPQVADFGLAKNITDKKGFTVTGQVMGTPQYMPPEQAKGLQELIGPHTDVYSMGAVLYEVFAGQPPFTGTTPIMIMYQVCEEEVVPPRKVRPDLPWEVEVIILKCLEKEPARRYASAQALADDLRAYLNGDTISARPANLFYKARKKIRKNKILSAVIASALAVSLAFGGWAMAEAGKAEKQKVLAVAMNAEAQKQKRIAENQRAEALASRQSAEEQKAKAQQAAEDEKLAKNQAEKARLEAEIAKQQAEQNLQQANAEKLLKERELYYIQVNNALNMLNVGEIDEARKVLLSTKPDMRGLEYRLLMKRASARLLFAYDGKTEGEPEETFAARNLLGSGKTKVKQLSPEIMPPGDLTRRRNVSFVAAKFSADSKKLTVFDSSNSVHELDLSTAKANLIKKRSAEPFFILNMSPICYEFHPEGTKLAIGNGRGVVQLKDYLTDEPIYAVQSHMGSVYSVSFSRDGMLLVSVGHDRRVAISDPATGKLIKKMEWLVGEGHAVAVSPDGARLALGYLNRYINICDIQTGNLLMAFGEIDQDQSRKMFTQDQNLISWDNRERLGKKAVLYITIATNLPAIQSLAFGPDGRLLAAGYDSGLIKVWDTTNGREIFVFQSDGGIVESLSFSPDGASLVSCNSKVMVWNVSRDYEMGVINNGADVSHMLFSPDNSRLYVTNKKDVLFKIYNPHTYANMKTSSKCAGFNSSNIISSDGRFVICSSATVSLEDIDNSETVYSFMSREGFGANTALTSDNRFFLALNSSNKIKVFMAKTGHLIREISPDRAVYQILPLDNEKLACRSGNSIITYDIASGKPLSEITIDIPSNFYFSGLVYNKEINCYAMPGCKKINNAFAESAVCLWDAKTGQLLKTMKGHKDEINTLAFADNGRRLLSGGKDLTVKVWDTDSGRDLLTLTGYGAEVEGIALAGDNSMFATADTNKIIKIWHAVGTDEPQNYQPKIIKLFN